MGSMISEAIANQLRQYPQFDPTQQFNPQLYQQGPDLITQAVQAARPRVSQFIHSPGFRTGAEIGGLGALTIPGIYAAIHGDPVPLEEVGEEARPLLGRGGVPIAPLREPPPMYQLAGPTARAGAEQRMIAGWRKSMADYFGADYDKLEPQARNQINMQINRLLTRVRQGQPLGDSRQILKQTYDEYMGQRLHELMGGPILKPPEK
jgi:hypothetical protein